MTRLSVGLNSGCIRVVVLVEPISRTLYTLACMARVMIQLLKDPHTSEDDKHTYRVLLASGLLSASWVRYPPKDFLAEADRHTFP